MTTKVTGKNQVTIPSKIAEQEGIRRGSIIEWRTTDREHVLEVHVYPDPVMMAEELRGRGKRAMRHGSGAVRRLLEEREMDFSDEE